MTAWASRLFAAAALALLAAPLAAQPTQLIPLPRQPTAPAETAPPAPSEPAERPVINPGPVQAVPLGALDPSSVGTLSGDAGYGGDLWTGSDRGIVERLIALLPVNERSVAARDLARRLLLTTAAVPEGQPTAKSILGLRVERLAVLGLTDAASDLAQRAPAALADPKLARAATDALLLRNDTAAACAMQQIWVRDDTDPFWMKLGFLCRVGDSDLNTAALVLSLVREQGVDDPAFLALADVLTNVRGAKLDSLPQPSPLQYAMLRAAKRPPPADALATASPAVAAPLVDLGLGDMDQRLAAAERAESAGTLPAASRARLYAAVTFSAEDKRDIAATVGKLANNPPRAAALLYQAAAVQSVPVARGELLRRLWQHADERGLFATVARAALPLAQGFAPSDELAFMARDMTRALLAAGDARTARQWQQWLLARPADDASAAAAAQIWLPMLVATPGSAGTVATAAWDKWLEAAKDAPEAQRQRRAAVAIQLLEGLGYQVPPNALRDALGARGARGETPAPPLTLRGALLAADAGRRGETALYALHALGTTGPAASDPGALSLVLASLRKAGFEADARALALEAVLANGL
jgi:hypothetical protein